MRISVVLLVAAVVLVAVATSIWVMADSGTDWLGIERRCRAAPFACGIVGGALITTAPLAIAFAVLMLWRLQIVDRKYRRYARKNPANLLGATVDSKDIVGRDDLCGVLQTDLQDRATRRPHVLVGGVGVGKTAVLVKFSELLASHGVVPVPIRLRDAQDGLDFHEEARARFRSVAARWTGSEAEGDTIWRKLRQQDRIVVVADGLEEALMDDHARESAIRVALEEVKRHNLPLVIASRPHDALTYLDAALIRLEPLSEQAAQDYIMRANGAREDATDRERIRRIVEQAEVVETPLYMQIVRQLHVLGVLKDNIDARHAGRVALRVRLLQEWTEQLIAGRIEGHMALRREDRERAVRGLGALACLGLMEDSLEVGLEAYKDFDFRQALSGEAPLDIELASSAGARLGLVEAQPKAVRFRHSIMQAYFAARRLDDLVPNTEYLRKALDKQPGRELLMATTMYATGPNGKRDGPYMRALLVSAADGRADDKGIDLRACAVEIEQLTTGGTCERSATALWEGCRVAQTVDEATQEAKLRAVARLGEPRRRPRRDGRGGPVSGKEGSPAREACQALWSICEHEDRYRVRLAAAQHLGSGGYSAYEALQTEFEAAAGEAEALYRDPRPKLDRGQQRRFALQGWILPLLVGSSEGTSCSDDVHALLARWTNLVGPHMHLSVEASLAQGFKYEANRQPERVTNRETRDFLVEQANGMLRKSQFWFSHVCLLQALTLWAIKAPPEPRADAQRRVGRWLGEHAHPLVRETAGLCIRALRTGDPSRFVWIDETGVASKVGPSSVQSASVRSRRLWISPAAGWLALDRVAQQVVADIILLLNLAERGEDASGDAHLQREDRLARASLSELPPCLTARGGREYLDVLATGGQATGPGSACMPHCDVSLCPYPPKEQRPFRGELSEAFCRSQRSLLAPANGRRAPWQKRASSRELRRFWADMERRAQV